MYSAVSSTTISVRLRNCFWPHRCLSAQYRANYVLSRDCLPRCRFKDNLKGISIGSIGPIVSYRCYKVYEAATVKGILNGLVVYLCTTCEDGGYASTPFVSIWSCLCSASRRVASSIKPSSVKSSALLILISRCMASRNARRSSTDNRGSRGLYLRPCSLNLMAK